MGVILKQKVFLVADTNARFNYVLQNVFFWFGCFAPTFSSFGEDLLEIYITNTDA